VKIYGLDFTSAPSRRKPLIALGCTLEEKTMRVEDSEEMTDFAGFEKFLGKSGPWICGMDFPFGQPRSLVSALGWPEGWEGYVGEVARLSQQKFENAIRADMAQRPAGSKYRYRLADRRSRSSSAMMLFRVPVGKMFYKGAPRLLASGVSVEPCRPNGDARVAVEAYPAVVARRFVARASYKNDERRKQTATHRDARRRLVAGLGSEILKGAYGFTVTMDGSWKEELVRDPAADALDSLLCAVQAAWAYTEKDEGYGVPPECDPNEGWIVDPHLLENLEQQPV
jgi:hypothetical protein